MTRCTVRADVVHGAVGAEEDQLSTGQVRAVVVLARGRATTFADTDQLRVVAELVMHSGVEEVQRTLPEAVVAERLAVAHDPACELIDLFESASNHQRGEDFATHATGAVRDDGLLFQMVVTAAIE